MPGPVPSAHRCGQVLGGGATRHPNRSLGGRAGWQSRAEQAAGVHAAHLRCEPAVLALPSSFSSAEPRDIWLSPDAAAAWATLHARLQTHSSSSSSNEEGGLVSKAPYIPLHQPPNTSRRTAAAALVPPSLPFPPQNHTPTCAAAGGAPPQRRRTGRGGAAQRRRGSAARPACPRP